MLAAVAPRGDEDLERQDKVPVPSNNSLMMAVVAVKNDDRQRNVLANKR